MLFYLIRLDDAHPRMDHSRWTQMELILDTFNIKPIVGIIPEYVETNPTIQEVNYFWGTIAKRYQTKKWTIAQHGCYHQNSNGTNSEFKGLSYEEQLNLINTGNLIMHKHGIVPEAFFAPWHAYDDYTVDACRDSGFFRFISDGAALFPYKYRDMLFYPTLFDSAHAVFPLGVFTFVYHPDQMEDVDFVKIESFIRRHRGRFADYPVIDENINNARKRNLVDQILESGVYAIRSIRG